jgi:chaperone required for assembly of F1-ATPase
MMIPKRRFWKEAEARAVDGGHSIFLDGRPVKTPAKAALIVPTATLAEAVATEWAAQDDKIDPNTMPMTRRANAAIDKVTLQHREVADMLAAYGETDLVSHRADAPEGLVARQAAAWDPALDWLEGRHGVRLAVVAGVIHAGQDAGHLARLQGWVRGLAPFPLTAFHDLVAMSGSLVLAMALVDGWAAPEDVWTLSRIDEDWQAELWGIDEDAARIAAYKRREFLDAARFFALSA